MHSIKFSEHAYLKLDILKSHGILLTIEVVQDAIANPDKIEEGYKGRMIAQKGLDTSHVVRVVYEKHGEEIKVITFYPGRRERYDKDKI
jgi:uncharacterized DUF497 family protein